MSTWFRKLFGSSGTVAQIDHPLYGRIAYSKRHGCWENEQFNLWGYSGVQLMIDADERGPTPRQDAEWTEGTETRNELQHGGTGARRHLGDSP